MAPALLALRSPTSITPDMLYSFDSSARLSEQPPTLTDEELMMRVQKEDPEALEALYQ